MLEGYGKKKASGLLAMKAAKEASEDIRYSVGKRRKIIPRMQHTMGQEIFQVIHGCYSRSSSLSSVVGLGDIDHSTSFILSMFINILVFIISLPRSKWSAARKPMFSSPDILIQLPSLN